MLIYYIFIFRLNHSPTINKFSAIFIKKEKLKKIQLKIHESLEHQAKKILANPKSFKIQLIDIHTDEIYTYESVRDAARQLSLIEGKSVEAIRELLRRRIKKEGLLLGKYKITKIHEIKYIKYINLFKYIFLKVNSLIKGTKTVIK